jgi:hypothetical protein
MGGGTGSPEVLHRAEFGRADLEAGAALGAFLLVDDVDLFLAAVNGFSRALLGANPAGLTLGRIDIVS